MQGRADDQEQQDDSPSISGSSLSMTFLAIFGFLPKVTTGMGDGRLFIVSFIARNEYGETRMDGRRVGDIPRRSMPCNQKTFFWYGLSICRDKGKAESKALATAIYPPSKQGPALRSPGDGPVDASYVLGGSLGLKPARRSHLSQTHTGSRPNVRVRARPPPNCGYGAFCQAVSATDRQGETDEEELGWPSCERDASSAEVGNSGLERAREVPNNNVSKTLGGYRDGGRPGPKSLDLQTSRPSSSCSVIAEEFPHAA